MPARFLAAAAAVNSLRDKLIENASRAWLTIPEKQVCNSPPFHICGPGLPQPAAAGRDMPLFQNQIVGTRLPDTGPFWVVPAATAFLALNYFPLHATIRCIAALPLNCVASVPRRVQRDER